MSNSAMYWMIQKKEYWLFAMKEAMQQECAGVMEFMS